MAKGRYGTWREDDMERVIAAYRNGDMGFNKCSRQYGVPKPTLKRYLDGNNITTNDGTKLMGHHTPITLEIERQLVQHIKTLEACLL